MIDLTRLNGHRLVLNCDLIKFAEPAPDTTITLITGEKLVVREGCDELIERTSAWRAQVLAGAGSVQAPLQSSALSAAIAFSAHQAIVTGSEQGS